MDARQANSSPGAVGGIHWSDSLPFQGCNNQDASDLGSEGHMVVPASTYPLGTWAYAEGIKSSTVGASSHSKCGKGKYHFFLDLK